MLLVFVHCDGGSFRRVTGGTATQMPDARIGFWTNGIMDTWALKDAYRDSSKMPATYNPFGRFLFKNTAMPMFLHDYVVFFIQYCFNPRLCKS